MSLSDDKQADIYWRFKHYIEIFELYLNINNVYWQYGKSNIPSKAITSETKTAFLDLHLSISNDIILPKFMINLTI